MKVSLFCCGLALASTMAFAGTNQWDTSVSLGINETKGNSETMTLSAGVLAERAWDSSSVRLALDGVYGEVSGSKTTEQAKALANYKRSISDRTYGMVDASLTYDAIADIDYRLILSPGVGYYVMKNDAAKLGLELGPSWITEKVGGASDDYFALRIGQRYDRTMSETAKVWQSLEYLPSVDDFEDDYLVNGEIGIEAQVNARVALRLLIRDAYDNTPAAGRERNDLSIVGALVYSL